MPVMPPVSATPRLPALDQLRGLALVWMTGFHLSYDLQYFGYFQANFYGDPFWTLQRSAIVSLFLLCAGLGQALALQQGQDWPRFWRRWRQIAACALLVSAGSWYLFAQAYIYFGILHGIALLLLVVRWLGGRWRRGSMAWLLLAALALLLPMLARLAHARWPQALDFLNQRAWNWLGLISHKPITEDYAPLLPWLAPVCLGMALGGYLQRHPLAVWQGAAWRLQASALGAMLRPLQRGLAVLGRWSLAYYMLHQPILFGALAGLAWLRGV